MAKLEVNIIIEILGRPPENVKEALRILADRIAAEKGIKINSKEFHEPILAEGSKDLYTAFMELTLELDDLKAYLNLVFGYMPSHIEIVRPENIQLSSSELRDLGVTVTARMHGYDAVAKQMLAEKEILTNQLYKYAPHLFKKAEKVPEQLSKEAQKGSKNKKLAKKKQSKKAKK